MKKSTLGIIAAVVIVGGGGGGCIVHQYLQTPTAERQAPAPTPSPVTEPTPAPQPIVAGTTLTVEEKDNGATLRVAKGTTIDFILHSTYWQIQPLGGDVLKPLAEEPTVNGTLSNPPGMGTGTVEMRYEALKDGTAAITATRTTCGEAMRCTGADGEFQVTLVVGAGPAGAPDAMKAAPSPAPAASPSPAAADSAPAPEPLPEPVSGTAPSDGSLGN